MGLFKKKQPAPVPTPEPPTLARRSLNRKSTIKSGRTIAEKREKLETASERTAAHKKIKRQQASRVAVTFLGFAIIAAILVYLGTLFFTDGESIIVSTSVSIPYAPTIEVVDNNVGSTGITARMKEYIGQLEADLKEYGYTPVKAVIPTGAIREVDFYLDGTSGFIKTTIDRGTGVTAEDADYMLRYLAAQGITDFTYIDVRLDGQAYWK